MVHLGVKHTQADICLKQNVTMANFLNHLAIGPQQF